MKSILKYKTTLLALILFTLLIYAYNVFFSPSSLEVPGIETAADIGDDLVKTYESLRSMTLDSSIFSSPEYLGLVDYSVTVPEEATGRPNPFNAIGSD